MVQHCNGSLFVEKEQKQKLIDCLAFLRALACKNEAIQIKYVVKGVNTGQVVVT